MKWLLFTTIKCVSNCGLSHVLKVFKEIWFNKKKKEPSNSTGVSFNKYQNKIVLIEYETFCSFTWLACYASRWFQQTAGDWHPHTEPPSLKACRSALSVCGGRTSARLLYPTAPLNHWWQINTWWRTAMQIFII